MNKFKQLADELEEMRRSLPPEWRQPIPLDDELKASLARTQERMRELPAEIAELSIQLAKRGWYTWMDMPFQFLFALKHALAAGELESVDVALMKYFKREGRRMESILLADFPRRAPLLREAFRAHRKKQYALSIPVLLAQADGICEELIGVGFYSRKKGVPRTAAATERLAATSAFMSSLLEPLRVSGALAASESERHDHPDVLNRHEVLHGKSVDYATPLGGFRAFSLLAYVGSALVTAKEYCEYIESRAAEGKDEGLSL